MSKDSRERLLLEAEAVELSRNLARERVKRSRIPRTKSSTDPDLEKILEVLRSLERSGRGKKRGPGSQRALKRLAGA